MIPIYNGQKFLSDTLGSLKLQEDKDFKVFICDDGSSVNCDQIIRSYKNDLNICVIKNEKNMGINYSLTRLVRIASKEFNIGIMLGQDDMLSSNYIKETKNSFQNNGIILLYSVLTLVDSFGLKTRKYIAPVNLKLFGNYKTSIMLHGNYVTSPGLAFRFENFPFQAVNKTSNLLHDWAQVRWSSMIGKIKISYKLNVYYRIHTEQISKKQVLSSTQVEKLKTDFVKSSSFQNFFGNFSKLSKKIFITLYLMLEGNALSENSVAKILTNSSTIYKNIPSQNPIGHIKVKRFNLRISNLILLPRIFKNSFLVFLSTLKFVLILMKKMVLNTKNII